MYLPKQQAYIFNTKRKTPQRSRLNKSCDHHKSLSLKNAPMPVILKLDSHTKMRLHSQLRFLIIFLCFNYKRHSMPLI